MIWPLSEPKIKSSKLSGLTFVHPCVVGLVVGADKVVGAVIGAHKEVTAASAPVDAVGELDAWVAA